MIDFKFSHRATGLPGGNHETDRVGFAIVQLKARDFAGRKEAIVLGCGSVRHRLVFKLKSARDRKRATGVKVEGRKIANALADAGHLNERGQPYSAKSVKAMVDGPRPKAIAR
jgi:hypothetical protein